MAASCVTVEGETQNTLPRLRPVYFFTAFAFGTFHNRLLHFGQAATLSHLGTHLWPQRKHFREVIFTLFMVY